LGFGFTVGSIPPLVSRASTIPFELPSSDDWVGGHSHPQHDNV
jgi:hypothetical protein